MKLRPYQLEAKNSIFHYFNANSGNPLVVAPTGSGKSVIIGDFVAEVLRLWPDQRILIVTHVKELVEQNYNKLCAIAPEVDAGIYSAGLNRRDSNCAVIFSSIQSIYSRAHVFGHIDLILVDECHLIPHAGNGMYLKMIKELKAVNPFLKVIGFTATPYRMGSGFLHEGKDAIFTDICYNIDILMLIEEGYLAPLVSKKPETMLNTDGVKLTAGEYNQAQLQQFVDQDDITRAAIGEVITLGADRKSWLFFCVSIDHAYHVRDELRIRGITAETVTGETPTAERDRILADYKNGFIRAITNVDVLTTGFDYPGIDLIAALRPTQSPGLWVQMCGRGMRVAEGKENCLVLDFAGNTFRHGPINEITPRKKGERREQSAPMKSCPECQTIVHIQRKDCPECGYEFPMEEKIKHDASASTLDIIQPIQYEKLNWFEVDSVSYSEHKKPGSPDSLKVTYRCGLRSFNEWVCLEHEGYAREKAEKWWIKRFGLSLPSPKTIEIAAIEIERFAHFMNVVTKILVDETSKYPRILNYEFAEEEAITVKAQRISEAG